MRGYLLSLALAVPLLAASCGTGPDTTEKVAAAPSNSVGAAAVDQQRINNADREPGSWLTAGRDYKEQRFSPLAQINDKNVGSIGLGLSWYGDIDTERGQEATPVVVDGVLYVTSAWSLVKAYDIKTGKKIWEYDPKVDREKKGADACCDVVNRGVAAWKGKIYLGALDGRLIALDGKTGAVAWETWTVPKESHYTITAQPRIANGKVFIGNGGAEYDVRGYVGAYDAENGKQLWKWWTVPGDPAKGHENKAMEVAAKTWKGDKYWILGGGGTVWDGLVYDQKTNMIYFGTGNGLSWAQELRSPGGGDNLYVSSIVALDADTGEYKWHYQETPGDEWDYDNCNPLMIADLKWRDGQMHHVVMQAPKQGFFYIMDAKTGKLLSADKYVPETNWASKVDMKTGRPVENPGVRYSASGKPALIIPAALGMHNWHPMAYSPVTGYVYIPITISNAAYGMQKDFKYNPAGWNTGMDFSGGADLYKAPGAPPRGNVTSYILAWDPVNSKEVFRIPNQEYGASGLLATDGNLIFSGNHMGELVAYDARDGKKLWSGPTGARVVAAPATYEVDGKQQVAVLVGARGLPPKQGRTSAVSANNSRILVFAAGGTAKLPTAMPTGLAAPSAAKINPPLLTANNETVAAGEQSYGQNCAVCHGRNAVPAAGATAPDLRYSELLRAPETYHKVVEGERAAQGMPSFKAILRPGEADSILAYIVKRANDEKAAQEAAVKAN
ncbi:MAG: PQQ-dependent dehydrogenase, methanol/ethanol family [Alphaproteobacteria bacterium]